MKKKRAAKGRALTTVRRPFHVPERQWHLPAGIHLDGRLASLRDVLDPRTPTIDGARLGVEQRAEVAIERMRQQEQFRVGVLGVGVVDKNRALAEMTAGSRLGQALIEIEHRAIRLMRDYASAAESRRRATARTRKTKPIKRRRRRVDR